MRVTALSPSGRAPLSSLHSFRYLAETFSLCLAFSKTCFMLGALQPSCRSLLAAPLSPCLSFFLPPSLSTHLPNLPPHFLFLVTSFASPCRSHPSLHHFHFPPLFQLTTEDSVPPVLGPGDVRASERERVTVHFLG